MGLDNSAQPNQLGMTTCFWKIQDKANRIFVENCDK